MSRKDNILIDGFKWPIVEFPVENFHNIRKLDLKDGDLVLNTYPKCGTVLTSYIIWSILNEGKPLLQPDECLKQMIFLDQLGIPPPNSYQGLSSHVPPPYFPVKACAKYIVTIRNPFDCCVSYYHFMQSKIVTVAMNDSFDQYFEKFLSGDVLYGDYFDHFLGWYKHRNDPNVKIMVYEEIIKDKKSCVLQLAKFIGDEYFRKMEGETLERIVEHTSFNHMKKTLDFGALESEKAEGQSKKGADFVRKGIVGDWRNHFSESQRDRLKEKMIEKLRGTEILDYWLKTLEL